VSQCRRGTDAPWALAIRTSGTSVGVHAGLHGGPEVLGVGGTCVRDGILPEPYPPIRPQARG